jgi:hypothetical protein
MEEARLLSDKRETVFARDRTNKQVLFANMNQPVVALVFFVERSLSKISFGAAFAMFC